MRNHNNNIEDMLLRILPQRADEPWMDAVFSGTGISPAAADALIAPAYDLVRRGGKRWRPLLMTLVCGAAGGNEADCLPLTPLVELPHNASLIHDDIEDHSDTRRGEPSVHIKYGEDIGINSGSFLYFLPTVCIDQWNAGGANSGADTAVARNAVWRLWAFHLRRLHLGQALDIQWHRSFDIIPTVDEYLAMCALKTGALARLAVTLGLTAVGIYDGEAAKKLGEAAEKLGVGFQILDDVRNLTTGNPGKKRGDDVVEGKKSLPVILYLRGFSKDNAREPRTEPPFTEKEFVRTCFEGAQAKGADAPEIEALIARLSDSGAIEQARLKGEALIDEAKAAFGAEQIAALTWQQPYRGALVELIESLRPRV